jgi:formyl-CoA transferase
VRALVEGEIRSMTSRIHDRSNDPGEGSGTESPLAGLRVVDLTQFESGPSATQLLAWLGADVVKVEPPGGDPSRSLLGADDQRESILFALLNQGKRSIVLDLKRDADRDVLFAMLADADVVSENFAPGTMARLGLDIDALRERFPRLVIATIRGYAPGGPWQDFRSFDFVAQAVAGAISVTGEPGRQPVRIGPTVADSGAGLHLAVGILAALLRRDRTGRGGTVDVSLQDAMVNLMRNAMGSMYVTGEPAKREGDAYSVAVPSGLHPCAPGGPNDYVYILLGNRRHWEGLLRAIDREDLIGDARYARQSVRNSKSMEVREIVAAWTRRHDKLEVMEHISAHGVPCGATLDTCELLVNPQLAESGMIFDQMLPGWGSVKLPGCPIRIDGMRIIPDTPPPLDADGDAIRRPRPLDEH